MSSQTAALINVYPFHQSYPGMPDLFHVSCAEHPDYGFCGERDQADAAATDHAYRAHTRPRRADR